MKSELQVSYLGTTFCKVDSSNLSDEALNAKVPKKGAMGRPKSKKPKPSESNLGEDTSKNEGEEEVALLFYGLCFLSYSKNLLFCLCVIMGTKNWNVLDFRISNSDKKWNAIRDHLSESTYLRVIVMFCVCKKQSMSRLILLSFKIFVLRLMVILNSCHPMEPLMALEKFIFLLELLVSKLLCYFSGAHLSA